MDPELRLAAFEARMKRVAGSERMQMRFALRERSAEGWRAVAAEDWATWSTSDPGVAEYRYTKEVGRLAAPATYRTVVRFRWLDAGGEVVARRTVRSKRCRQPDLRPDLRVTSIEHRATGYLVRVSNAGRTRAAASQLELTVEGQPYVVEVGAVKARSTRSVEVEAPRCTPGGSGLVAVADHGDAIDERDEADNVLGRDCPLLR